jgi:hypothetical protein
MIASRVQNPPPGVGKRADLVIKLHGAGWGDPVGASSDGCTRQLLWPR